MIANTIQLTDSQQKAFDAIKDFLGQKRKQHFVLTGYAGTGKSFLIKQIVDYISNQRLIYTCASPTNKASKNLKQLGIKEVTTVAKLLKQVPSLDTESGKEVFVTKSDRKMNQLEFSTYNVVIIDEYSMINKDTLDKIMYELLIAPKTKVIFVGDNAQLPPVKEEKPAVEVAMNQYNFDHAELTEVMRYDGEIAKVAEEIRSNSKYNKQFYPFHQVTDGTIEVLEPLAWCMSAIEYFETGKEENNLDYCRIIAYTNKTCDRANEFIRARLFPEADLPYVKGDKLITKKPLMRLNPDSRNRDDKWLCAVQTSEELEVMNDCTIEPVTIESHLNFTLNCYKFKIKTEDGLIVTCKVPVNYQDVANKLAEYKQEKKWYEYYDLIKQFDNVSYPYALTCHKAQGSGYEYVFLDIMDMKRCNFKQKMVYTALTRAKQKAFIRMG